jgi:hypothetical protein
MAGPPFTVFDLVAGSGYLTVLSVVPPLCPIRSTVTVEGDSSRRCRFSSSST